MIHALLNTNHYILFHVFIVIYKIFPYASAHHQGELTAGLLDGLAARSGMRL